MGLIIIMSIPYIILLVTQVLHKKKSIRIGEKTDNIEELIITIFGNSMLVYVSSNQSFTSSMRTVIIIIFTVLYIIFWLVSFAISNKEKGSKQNL